MKTTWIGPDEFSMNDVGFLIHHSNEIDGGNRYELRDTPAYTNRSCEPRLHGWCGTYNNLATYAEGLVKVIQIARNGRAKVAELEGEELRSHLEDLGYPELI